MDGDTADATGAGGAALPLSGDAAVRAAPVWTVEHAAYALIVLVGLAARLLALGVAPFAPDEAAAAWPAWLWSQMRPVPNVPPAESALLSTLHSLLFGITGRGGDGLARVPVALLAAAVPLLPWVWRGRLGRGAALALALLLALDPWLLALARRAQSASLSITLGLATLTALEAATRTLRPARHAGALAAAGVGLLLVSGPQAWSWLVVVALFLLLAADAPSALRRPGLLAVAAASALAGATLLLARPLGVAAVGSSLSVWLEQLSGGPYGVGHPWLRLLVDQPFVLVFGLLGFGLLWRRPAQDDGARLFLSAWLLWAAALLLLPGRTPFALPLLGIPLAVCAAHALAWFGRLARREEEPREALLLALVLAGILLSLLFWTAGLVWSRSTPGQNGWIAAAMLLLALLLLVGDALLVRLRQALGVGLAVGGLALYGATLSATWELVYVHDMQRPDGFFALEAHNDARALTDDVHALSDRRTGTPTGLPVVVVTGAAQPPDVQLGWLLRDMQNLHFAASPTAAGAPGALETQRAPVVITPQGSSEAWDASYIGSARRLRFGWLPSALPSLVGHEDPGARWNDGWRPWLRWLLYREAAAPEAESVLLWATP